MPTAHHLFSFSVHTSVIALADFAYVVRAMGTVASAECLLAVRAAEHNETSVASSFHLIIRGQ
jgi:hypothetical protein